MRTRRQTAASDMKSILDDVDDQSNLRVIQEMNAPTGHKQLSDNNV